MHKWDRLLEELIYENQFMKNRSTKILIAFRKDKFMMSYDEQKLIFATNFFNSF